MSVTHIRPFAKPGLKLRMERFLRRTESRLRERDGKEAPYLLHRSQLRRSHLELEDPSGQVYWMSDKPQVINNQLVLKLYVEYQEKPIIRRIPLAGKDRWEWVHGLRCTDLHPQDPLITSVLRFFRTPRFKTQSKPVTPDATVLPFRRD